MTKTYTRARTARAALQKLLDMHESGAKVVVSDAGVGRFAASAVFLAIPPLELQEDLEQAGFAMVLQDPVTGPGAAIIDMGEAGDATPYPTPASATEAPEAPAVEADPVVEAPAKKKATGYIHGVSLVQGPTKRVWAIADAMPGAARKDVIAACAEAGITYGTARTQYQKWFKAQQEGDKNEE